MIGVVEGVLIHFGTFFEDPFGFLIGVDASHTGNLAILTKTAAADAGGNDWCGSFLFDGIHQRTQPLLVFHGGVGLAVVVSKLDD